MKVKNCLGIANYKLRIEFIDEKGNGPGVRLRKPAPEKELGAGD
jgi:hypothetical protein